MLKKKRLSNLLRDRKFYVLLAVLAFMVVLPVIDRSAFTLRILTLVTVLGIYASSWNLLAYSGQGSLGHAAFLGIGGFVSSLIAINLGLPALVGLLFGGVFAAGIGLLIGLACVRLKAWFLAMVTFGFSVIAAAVITALDPITHGTLGFPPVPLAPSGLPFYLLTVTVATLSIIAIYMTMKSKLGLAFKAIRENELEARMIGIHVAKYKLLAFVVSTFFAGIAGGLYVQTQGYVSSSVFSADNSFKPLMMSVIGGLGTIEGPIIGSAIIVAIDSFAPNLDRLLQPILSPLFPAVSAVGPPLRLLALGLFLILILIFLPKGIASLIPRIYGFFREDKSKVKADAKA
jgi:branched-chain amino acid transport system permease protein